MTVEVGEDSLVLRAAEREDAAVHRHPPLPFCSPFLIPISQHPHGVSEDPWLRKCDFQSERVGWFGVVSLPFISKICPVLRAFHGCFFLRAPQRKRWSDCTGMSRNLQSSLYGLLFKKITAADDIGTRKEREADRKYALGNVWK